MYQYFDTEIKKEVVGNIMTNTILIILVSLGIKVINESNQPKYYEVTYLDGTTENVMVDNNSDYICPGHCSVSHAHTVSMCEGDCEYDFNQITINKNINNNSSGLFRGQEIKSIELIDNIK